MVIEDLLLEIHREELETDKAWISLLLFDVKVNKKQHL